MSERRKASKEGRTPNDTVEQYLERLAQLVDWLEACFTDAQLKAAVRLLGNREEVGPAPLHWIYPLPSSASEVIYKLRRDKEEIKVRGTSGGT